jgi:hypothetical protein
MPATISTETNDASVQQAASARQREWTHTQTLADDAPPLSSESSEDVSEPISSKMSLKKDICDNQKLKKKTLGLGNLEGGVSGHIVLRKLPSKHKLTEQLRVSVEALDDAKKETYQKKFRLWSKKPLSLSRARVLEWHVAESILSPLFSLFL